jgi:hypothetical protein
MYIFLKNLHLNYVLNNIIYYFQFNIYNNSFFQIIYKSKPLFLIMNLHMMNSCEFKRTFVFKDFEIDNVGVRTRYIFKYC